MTFHMWFRPGLMLAIPLSMVLILAVACGGDDAAPIVQGKVVTVEVEKVVTVEVEKVVTEKEIVEVTKEVVVVATPTKAPAGAFMTSTVDRLVFVLAPPGFDNNLPWGMNVNSMAQLRPMFEPLLGTDRVTGAYIPQLATEWKVSSDAKTWTVNLVKDVPFHFGFGNFTSQDVVQSYERLVAEGSLATDRTSWKSLVKGPEDIVPVGDHEVVFNLTRGEPDMEFHFAARVGNFVQTSKAQWDAEDLEGFRAKPAGTGPYQFVERQLGQALLYERVEDHWRKTPEFKELMLRWVPEDATRLAVMQTKQAHILDLPRVLQNEALERGFKLNSSSLPGTPFVYNFGGLLFHDPSLLDDSNPFNDVKVREAMNRSINREELNEFIFAGRGELSTPLQRHHPSLPGWDSSWDTRYGELYGYDPEKAKQLLSDAGYPNGFSFRLYRYPWSGLPELADITDALGIYFNDIGITAEIQDLDWPEVFSRMRAKNVYGEMMGLPSFGMRLPHLGMRVTNHSSAAAASYTHPFMEQKFEELGVALDPQERADIQQAMGEHLFTNYYLIPLFTIFSEYIIDPEVVAEWQFSNLLDATYSDLEHIKAAK